MGRPKSLRSRLVEFSDKTIIFLGFCLAERLQPCDFIRVLDQQGVNLGIASQFCHSVTSFWGPNYTVLDSKR